MINDRDAPTGPGPAPGRAGAAGPPHLEAPVHPAEHCPQPPGPHRERPGEGQLPRQVHPLHRLRPAAADDDDANAAAAGRLAEPAAGCVSLDEGQEGVVGRGVPQAREFDPLFAAGRGT